MTTNYAVTVKPSDPRVGLVTCYGTRGPVVVASLPWEQATRLAESLRLESARAAGKRRGAAAKAGRVAS